jgi:hypothetical protein
MQYNAAPDAVVKTRRMTTDNIQYLVAFSNIHLPDPPPWLENCAQIPYLACEGCPRGGGTNHTVEASPVLKDREAFFVLWISLI